MFSKFITQIYQVSSDVNRVDLSPRSTLTISETAPNFEFEVIEICLTIELCLEKEATRWTIVTKKQHSSAVTRGIWDRI